MKPWYEINASKADIAKEREKARKLRTTNWWKQKLAVGVCHYCEKKFEAKHLTMDHIVPLARGGKSTESNTVPACAPCNQSKSLETPAERLLRELAEERKKNESESSGE